VKASSWLAAGQAVPVGQGVRGARPMPSRPPNVKGFEFGNPQLEKHACMHQVSVHFFPQYKLTSQRRWSWQQVDARHVGRKPARDGHASDPAEMSACCPLWSAGAARAEMAAWVRRVTCARRDRNVARVRARALAGSPV
jgi:hypothetical protein